jgi:hypothetical protein
MVGDIGRSSASEPIQLAFLSASSSLHEGLMQSDNPVRKQQAAGWKVVRHVNRCPAATLRTCTLSIRSCLAPITRFRKCSPSCTLRKARSYSIFIVGRFLRPCQSLSATP